MNVGLRERERERDQQDATNLTFIIKFLSQHVSGIIMPIISVHCRIWCSALVVMAVVVWSWDESCVRCEGHCSTQSKLATVLMNYHIRRLVLSSLCVGDLVRLVLDGVRFAGWRGLQKSITQNHPHQISNT